MNDLPPSVAAVREAVEENAIKNNHSKPFTLKWKGSKVPRGHKINGVEIAWTQHGFITGGNREQLGTYTRTVEWGGPNGDEHEMLIVPAHGSWCDWLPDNA